MNIQTNNSQSFDAFTFALEQEQELNNPDHSFLEDDSDDLPLELDIDKDFQFIYLE